MNRRVFLQTGLGAVAGLSASRVFGAASNRVRLALIGCRNGGRGIEVARALFKVPNVEIATVCDVDARARDFGAALVEKQTGVKPRKEVDLRKVLEDASIDGIISETPDHWHAWSAVMAMRAGKHVYVEKPCAFDPHECEVILRTWKETGKVFQMGSQRRSAPAFRSAIAEIQQGLIGETKWGKCWYATKRAPIGNGKKVVVPDWLNWDLWQGPAPRRAYQDNVVHYNWHWFKEWGTGECGNNSVHFVDVARWCLGVDWPSRVTSDGGKLWIPENDDWVWPDTQQVTWHFSKGKMITWEGLSCVNKPLLMGVSTGALVYGTKGYAFFSPTGAVTVFDLNGRVTREWDVKGRAAEVTNTDNRSGGGWADTTSEHLANFVDAIRANKPEMAYANADAGVKSTYLANVANVSQLCGESIEIDSATGKARSATAAKYWQRAYEKGWEI